MAAAIKSMHIGESVYKSNKKCRLKNDNNHYYLEGIITLKE